MKTILKEFLTNGQLGEITLKSTRHKVRQLLGEPQDWGFSKFKNKAALWKYGRLQLGFVNDQVTFLGLYYHDNSCLPRELNVVGYFPTKQTACQEFRKYLWCEQLDYQVDPSLSFDSQLCLAVGAARVIFDTDTNQIESLQYAKPKV